MSERKDVRFLLDMNCIFKYIVAVYETHTKRIYNINSMMIPQKICVYSVYYLFCWKVDKMVGSGRETSSCGS